MSRSLAFVAVLTLLSGPVWAAESGVMIKDEVLRAGASATAAETGSIGKDTQVEILARQGGWSQVRHPGGSGWVRLLSVRKGEVSRGDAGADLVGALSIGLSRRDPNRVTATTGLRGLDEEQLRAARFDAGQLQNLEGYAVSAADARQFAAAGKLKAREVDDLPAKSASTNANASDGSFNLMGGQ
jgi:hypothetical protein